MFRFGLVLVAGFDIAVFRLGLLGPIFVLVSGCILLFSFVGLILWCIFHRLLRLFSPRELWWLIVLGQCG